MGNNQLIYRDGWGRWTPSDKKRTYLNFFKSEVKPVPNFPGVFKTVFNCQKLYIERDLYAYV